MDEYLREMLNSAKDNLNIFLDGDVKEVREILAKNGYYIDPIAFALLNVTQPVIKKVQDFEKNE